MNRNPKSFAYIQNQRIPNEYAFGIYVVHTCNAASKLAYKSYLIRPFRTQTQAIFNQGIWDYYGLHRDSFKDIKLDVPEMNSTSALIEHLFKHFRHLIITWFFVFKALAFIKRENIQLIQTTSREMIILLKLFAQKNTKIIYDLHIEPRNTYERLTDWLMIKMGFNVVLTNNKFLKELYQKKGIQPKNIITEPCGFDENTFSPENTENKDTARKKLSLPIAKYIIGYIGRFETLKEEKGIEDLLKVAVKLKKTIPICILAVGGPKDLVNKYQRQAKELGLSSQDVIIRDLVPPKNVPLYLSAIDVATILYPDTPHYREKMSPQKAVEYMAMKKIIIASDLPAIKDVLPENSAYYVKPNNISSLAEVINLSYQDKIRSDKKANNAFHYVQKYSWVQRQQRILEFLESSA